MVYKTFDKLIQKARYTHFNKTIGGKSRKQDLKQTFAERHRRMAELLGYTDFRTTNNGMVLKYQQPQDRNGKIKKADILSLWKEIRDKKLIVLNFFATDFGYVNDKLRLMNTGLVAKELTKPEMEPDVEQSFLGIKINLKWHNQDMEKKTKGYLLNDIIP